MRDIESRNNPKPNIAVIKVVIDDSMFYNAHFCSTIDRIDYKKKVEETFKIVIDYVLRPFVKRLGEEEFRSKEKLCNVITKICTDEIPLGFLPIEITDEYIKYRYKRTLVYFYHKQSWRNSQLLRILE